MPIDPVRFLRFGKDLFGRPYVPLILSNGGAEELCYALIDTGADHISIPGEMARDLGWPGPGDKPDGHIKTASGEAPIYHHIFDIDVFKKAPFDQSAPVIQLRGHNCTVIEGAHCVLLGRDFLQEYVLTVNYVTRRFSLKRASKKPHHHHMAIVDISGT